MLRAYRYRSLGHFRFASTDAAGHYPFPTHRHPQPHEIFHLPKGASQAEIRSRCMYIEDDLESLLEPEV